MIGIHFHPSLIFAGKVGAYQSWALKGLSSYGYTSSSSLANNYETRVEVNNSGKHSSLLKCGKNIAVQSFTVQTPGGMYYKTSYGCNLWIIVIS
jgi:hypothetical protein